MSGYYWYSVSGIATEEREGCLDAVDTVDTI